MNFSAEYQNTGSWCYCLFDSSFPKWEKIGTMALSIQLRTPTTPSENSYTLTSEMSALNVLLSTLRWSEPQLYLRRQTLAKTTQCSSHVQSERQKTMTPADHSG
jgi:hypothetical protein